MTEKLGQQVFIDPSKKDYLVRMDLDTVGLGKTQPLILTTGETLIFVKFALPGIHCYPDAPDDVSYLRSPHRHLFHFKVGVPVNHANREIEFHQFLN